MPEGYAGQCLGPLEKVHTVRLEGSIASAAIWSTGWGASFNLQGAGRFPELNNLGQEDGKK